MENESVNYIADIDTSNNAWKLKVRVLKLWKTSFQLGMILMDEKSDKIEASVKNYLFPKFEALLSEGIVVFLSQFGVGENSAKYPNIKHPYKLNFYRGTTLKTCPNFDGPLYGFNFLPFAEIDSHADDPNLPVDVIGCVVDCGDLHVYNKASGTEGKRLSLEIEDLSGSKVNCTFWDDYAVNFHDYVSSTTTDNHLILIIQFARIRKWKGYTIQNALFSTKIFINSDIVEINEFRKRYIERVGPSPSSQGGSHLSSHKLNSLHEEFLSSFPNSTIDEVVDSTETRVCVVLATVRSVDEKRGWFYVACQRHHSKVVKKSAFVNLDDTDGQDDEDDGGLYCLKCKGKASSVFLSFKLHIRVQDSTGTTSFVLFDRELGKLLHKKASEIHAQQELEGDPDRFPSELYEFVGKRFLFKIQISKYNIENGYQVYTIMKVCDDTNIIKAFMETYPDNQDADQEANNLLSNKNYEDDAAVENKDVLSSMGDSSSPFLDVKRSRNEYDDCGIGEGSSTKKKIIKVKIEKD